VARKYEFKPAKQFVYCYFCGRRLPRSKAIPVIIRPNLVPEVKESEKPVLVMAAPIKAYVCPSCARFRGIHRSDWIRQLKEEEKERELEQIMKALKL